MARLCAELVYAFNGLVVEKDLFGASVVGESDGMAIELCLPFERSLEGDDHGEPSFDRFPGYVDFPLTLPGALQLFGRARSSRSSVTSVDEVLLRVTWEVPAGHWLFGSAAGAALERAREVGNRVIESLIAVARSEGRQAWLGMSGEAPTPKFERLLNLDAHEMLPQPAIAARSFWPVPEKSALTLDTLSDFVNRAAEGEDVPLAEALLADALHLRWGKTPPQATSTLSVLLAAIACEVRVKAVVRRIAGEQLKLVELLIGRPRDFSTAVRTLFTDVMVAASGRSLKEEDPNLEKAVGRLFDVRNGIAHEGKTATPKEASECCAAAETAFDWLSAVERDVPWVRT
jgi:hypothetical protein